MKVTIRGLVAGELVCVRVTLAASKLALPLRRVVVEPFCKHVAKKFGASADAGAASAKLDGAALDLAATPADALADGAVVDVFLGGAAAPPASPPPAEREPEHAVPEPARPRAWADAPLTWTCTFNGRLEPFFRTLASFLRETSAASQRLVRDWVVVADRGATTADRVAIVTRAPWVTLVCKGKPLHRHPCSINLLLDGFVKTRWWLEWEDDWVMPPGSGAAPGGDVVQRALAVQRASGATQVAMNGAFLDIPADCEDYAVRDCSAGPVDYVTVALGPEQHAAVVGCASPEALAQKMAPDRCAENMAGGRVPPWPLFSLQPSLLDADYVRTHMYPFAERAHMNDQDAYWLWELEAALKFVKHGATKASIKSRHVARQIDVETSSLDDPADRARQRAAGRAAGPKPAKKKFAIKSKG